MSIGWIVVSVWFGGWLVASCFVAARSESEDDAFAGITMLMVWPGLLLMCTVLAPAYLSWRIGRRWRRAEAGASHAEG